MRFTLFKLKPCLSVLLASDNIQTLVCNLGGRPLSQCYWILIVAAVLCPVLWLGTPKDFWVSAIFLALDFIPDFFLFQPLAIAAAGATAIAVVLIIVQAGLDYKPGVQYGTSTFSQFFLAAGTMAFAFGGTNFRLLDCNTVRDQANFFCLCRPSDVSNGARRHERRAKVWSVCLPGLYKYSFQIQRLV